MSWRRGTGSIGYDPVSDGGLTFEEIGRRSGFKRSKKDEKPAE